MANVFTHLRKIAQHPLLVRRLFSDERVTEMAKLAHARCASSTGVWLSSGTSCADTRTVPCHVHPARMRKNCCAVGHALPRGQWEDSSMVSLQRRVITARVMRRVVQ